MSDSKIGSINKYSIGNVSKISTNTSIMKRPYDSAFSYSDKKDNNSRFSKRNLKSPHAKESSDDQTNDFTNLLSNELNDRLLLDSRETSRVIHTDFNNNHSDKTDSPELHAKLRDAMSVKVDTSELYKKLQLLSTLK